LGEMKKDALIAALGGYIGNTLAKELTEDFVKIRQDFATKTLERASCGKFVETFVQCLQYLSTNNYDNKPNVDDYLGRKAENEASLPEGLRICAARIARSVYTLRNKRNIAHKNEVDPNTFDLAYIYHGAAWIMAELIRNASGIGMEAAGKLIELLQVPVGTLVEEIEGTRLIHAADASVRVQIQILLHSHYPDRVSVHSIVKSLHTEKEVSIKKRLVEMRGENLIFGDIQNGYKLTQTGYTAAIAAIQKLNP